MISPPRMQESWPRILATIAPQRWFILTAIFFMAIVSASEVAIPALMKPLLDKGFGGTDPRMWWLMPLTLISLALARGIAQFCSDYFLNLVSNNILLTFRERMFDRMLHACAQFFSQQSTSSLINTIVFEVNQVLQIFSNVLISLVRDSLTVLGLLGYLFYLNWRLTLIVAIILPPIAWLISFANRRLRQLGRAHQEATNQLAYVVEEASGGYKVVKIHGAQTYEQQRFNNRARALRGYAMRMAITSGMNQPITQLLATIALSTIVALAILQASAQQTTVGGFAAFITAMLMLISPLKRLADISQPLQRGKVAAEMIFRLLDEEDEAQALANGSKPLERAQGALNFEQVSFAYPRDLEKNVLQQINLHIAPGQIIAFVGPSGGGKSTLVNLIPRFLLPQSGRITLDNLPIEEIALTDLRRQIAFVSQDVVLFNDSVAANVAYGVHAKDIDYARVQAAIDAAYLTETVASLPQGLNTQIGDNGNQLSGGQRQRLAIARAIYKDAPILILDEATSALDSESEHQVQKALIRLMHGRTTLVIAHRLSTIERADQIIVLDQGKIVEQGSHTELLALNKLYASLYHLQFQNLKTNNS